MMAGIHSPAPNCYVWPNVRSARRKSARVRGPVVAYYRVSTDRQGRSGLGLEAQREAVRVYLAGGGSHVVAEHQEVESGRNSDRPALEAALAEARLHRCPLVVAKVDRLTRSVAFLSRLLEAGVDVRFADLPQIEGATGRFMLTQMVSVAELEAGLISARTKAALAAKKKRLSEMPAEEREARKAKGERMNLGTPENLQNGAAGRVAAQAARTRKAAQRARDLLPVIAQLRQSGALSLGQIADGLTTRGIPAARGGKWSAVQVSRVLEHAEA